MVEKKTRKQKKIRKNIENICELNKNCVKNLIKEYIYIAFGCLAMAVGVSQFLLPNELSTGGFSGIAIIVYYLTNYPMGTTMLILNIPLLLIAYFKVGKQLFARSIYGTVLFSVFVDLLDRIEPLTHDKFLACIYGGIFMGVGTAVILKFNSSTGGSDLLSYVIRAYKPQYRSSNLILFIDVIIITANVIFFKTIEICNCNIFNGKDDRLDFRGHKLYQSFANNFSTLSRNCRNHRKDNRQRQYSFILKRHVHK